MSNRPGVDIRKKDLHRMMCSLKLEVALRQGEIEYFFGAPAIVSGLENHVFMDTPQPLAHHYN